MENYDREELREIGIVKLRVIGKNLKVKAAYRYKKEESEALINEILKQQRASIPRPEVSPVRREEDIVKKMAKVKITEGAKTSFDEWNKLKLKELQKIAKTYNVKSITTFSKKDLINEIMKKKPSPMEVPPVAGPSRERPTKLTKEVVLRETLEDIKKRLRVAGITEALTGKEKEQLVKWLFADKCDPETDLSCPNNLVCDVRNKICISEDEAKVDELASTTINGRKIVGTVDAIEALNRKMGKMEVEPEKCDPFNNKYCPGDMTCDIRTNTCVSLDKVPKGLVSEIIQGRKIIGTREDIDNLFRRFRERDEQPPPSIPSYLKDIRKELPEKLQEVDIEDVLEEITIKEPTKKPSISDINKIQRQLYECFGLPSE